jgi:predicted nucleic acid-binding protein
MKRVLFLDTNHLSAAINPVSRLRERLYQEHRGGARFRTSVPVLCELEAGIQDSPHLESYRRQLAHLLRKVKLIPLEPAVAQIFGEIYRELRRRGRPLSQVDMMSAAMVRHLKFTLLTSDRDFEALPDIRSDNWLD